MTKAVGLDDLPNTREALVQMFEALRKDGIVAAGVLLAVVPRGQDTALVVTALPLNTSMQLDGHPSVVSTDRKAAVTLLLTAASAQIGEMLKEGTS